MSKPSKSHLLYEANMKLQKAYAEITRLEEALAESETGATYWEMKFKHRWPEATQIDAAGKP